MNITLFTTPKAIITLVASLVLIIDPNLVLAFLGAPLEPGGVMMARVVGGAYLGSGVAIWAMKEPGDVSPKDAWFYALGEAISATAVFICAAGGYLNVFGWALGFAYVGFSLGFVWVALRSKAEQNA